MYVSAHARTHARTHAHTHLWIPVMLSSTTPFTYFAVPGYFFSIKWVASPPSSRIYVCTHTHTYICMYVLYIPGPALHSLHTQLSSAVAPKHSLLDWQHYLTLRKSGTSEFYISMGMRSCEYLAISTNSLDYAGLL